MVGHPALGLVRNQHRLNFSEQGTSFGKRESQVSNTMIPPFQNSNDRCRFSRCRTFLVTFQAGFDDESHGTSNWLLR
jgi:hypothetical protein